MKKVNLFCLPFAGGSKYSYKGYGTHAPKNLNVVPIEIPGRGSRYKEPLLKSAYYMMEDIYKQIKDKLKDPYAIYGHSMGTLLAYLLTKKIIQQGHLQPLHLFLSGRGGPSVRDNEPIRYLLPKKEFFNKIKELGGSPDEILNDNEMMSFFEPILRADFQAVETYVHKEDLPFDIPISVFIGIQEKTTFEEALAWQKETTDKVEVRQFLGKHFFIFNYEQELINIMSSKLLSNRIYA